MPQDLVKIRRALLSVSDKAGIVDFARTLLTHGVEILSTGGTAKLLRLNGVVVTEVGDYTGFPEMMDGRVKTLHPKVHGGILARRDLEDHVSAMQKHGIPPIDMVVVNLYPFARTVAKPGCSMEDAIENIDIGGPAMVRAAAKNHAFVAIVTDPADYAGIVKKMKAQGGALGLAERYALAAKAFSHTAEYDGMISSWLTARDVEGKARAFPERLNQSFRLAQTLRYGENPHQSAAFYVESDPPAGTLARFRQVQGKELSYNNIADADAAWECCRTFEVPACVIVKHANPCGVAISDAPLSAYRRAFLTDPTSAFGGIIAFNRSVDGPTAEAVAKQFVEVVIAPSYDEAARKVFAAKQNVRLLTIDVASELNRLEMKRVGGGLLVQTPDDFDVSESRVVTKKKPTDSEMNDLVFAFRVAKFVKSNAIVFCGAGMTLGVGAGQMSRVDSTRIAVIKAKNAGLSLQGSVAASDAFFPFRDGLDVVARAGARAVIQPGGSVRDEEVIAAADEHRMAMVVTGMRHFPPLKLLVIGSGGREHALAWHLARTPRVSRVYVAPGNAGTAREDGLFNVDITGIPELVKFARDEQLHLTVVGPEAPLAAGVVDVFQAAGLSIFGPTKAAAQLESSKDFAKQFMVRHGIPTAHYATFTEAKAAHAHIDSKGAPIVIKADGLAAGKGVVVAMTRAEAHEAIDMMLAGNKLGDAGHQVVVEEFMAGEEASFIVMADGHNVLPFASSQDHKRIFDGDKGPNTGGMGAYSPAPVVTPEVHNRVMREIILPTVRGMASESNPYTGFLYAGLMIDEEGAPRVVEFNCRMGDPETQPIFMRLKSDFLDLVEHALDGTLDAVEVDWDRRAALGVVLAAAGYPDAPRKGDEITGLPKDEEDFHVFHAGTAMKDGKVVTNGGRVLCVTALGDKVKIAAERAYAVAEKIRFDGLQIRRDIGHRAFHRR